MTAEAGAKGQEPILPSLSLAIVGCQGRVAAAQQKATGRREESLVGPRVMSSPVSVDMLKG